MEIFRLFGTILVDNEKANKSLQKTQDELGKTDGKFKNSMAVIGKWAKGLAIGAAVGVGALLVQGFKDAVYAQEKVAQLDAVLKSTNGTAGMTRQSLLDLAEGFEKTTKFSAESALEAESMLLTFTNIGKDTFPRATQAAADMATALGTDMAGQSVALGKALNDPIKGISALSRVGVTFTDEQKKQIKAMQEAGDMAGAQTVILKELEKEFGGSAEAAGKTFGGQLVILKNAFGGVVESISAKALPWMEKLVGWVINNMPKIKDFVEDAMDAVSAVFDQVKPVIDSVIDAIKNLVISAQTEGTIFNLIWENLKGLFSAGLKIIKGVFDAFSALFKGDWSALWSALGTIVEGFFEIFKTIGKSLFGKLFEGIKEKWTSIKEWVDEKVQWIKDQFLSLGINIKEMRDNGGGMPHASGINYVPYDGYQATLHRGERVVTANDNIDLSGEIVTLLKAILDKSGQNIVLDTGVLVGATAESMDMALGRLQRRR